MGKELTILAVVGSLIFGLWYLNKEGCKGEGPLMGPEGSLCWSGESLSDMMGGIGGGSGGIGGGFSEEEVTTVRERNAARQITPAAKRGLISRTQTSDPVGSGGGVGGPGYKSAWAYAYPTFPEQANRPDWLASTPPYGRAYGYRDTKPPTYQQNRLAHAYHIQHQITIA